MMMCTAFLMEHAANETVATDGRMSSFQEWYSLGVRLKPFPPWPVGTGQEGHGGQEGQGVTTEVRLSKKKKSLEAF